MSENNEITVSADLRSREASPPALRVPLTPVWRADAFSWQEAVVCMWQARHCILPAMAVMLTGGVLAALLVQPRYIASSKLLVLLSSEYSGQRDPNGTAAGNAVMERETFMKVETEILTSRAVARDAVAALGTQLGSPSLVATKPGPARPDLDPADMREGRSKTPSEPDTALPGPLAEERAAARIDANLSASADKAANVIQVDFKASTPEMARRTLDLIMRAYLARRESLFADVQSAAFAEQANLASRQLVVASQALDDFKTRNGISDYDTQRELSLRQRDDTLREIHASESSERQGQMILATIDHALASTPSQVMVASDDDKQARLSRLRANLDDLRARESGLLIHYGANSPVLIELRSQISLVATQLAGAYSDPGARSVRMGRSALYDGLAMDRSRALEDLSAARARNQAAQAQLAQEQIALSRLEGRHAQLQTLDRQHSLLEQHYRSILSSLQDHQLIEWVNSRRLTNVRAINGARSVVVKQDVRVAALAVGVLLAALAGFTGSILSYVFRRGFSTAAELERLFAIPVLATLRDGSASDVSTQ